MILRIFGRMIYGGLLELGLSTTAKVYWKRFNLVRNYCADNKVVVGRKSRDGKPTKKFSAMSMMMLHSRCFSSMAVGVSARIPNNALGLRPSMLLRPCPRASSPSHSPSRIWTPQIRKFRRTATQVVQANASSNMTTTTASVSTDFTQGNAYFVFSQLFPIDRGYLHALCLD